MATDSASAHLGLGLIAVAPLAYAGVSKLLDPQRFARVLPAFGLPVPAAAVSASVLGACEFAIALSVVLLAAWPTAAALSLAYIAFAVALERAHRRGAAGDCGCFGALRATISRAAVGRNLALAALALLLTVVRATSLLDTYELGLAMGAVVALGLGSASLDTALSVRAARR